MNIESVYTANAFVSGGRTLVGAGSETTPAVYLQDLTTGESSLVADCPGGVMSFVPVPEHEDVYFSVMGLFPGFQGLEAGIHMHVYSEGKWTTRKVFDLPFAHRCDVVRRDGKNYLFAVSCSRHKDSPADWSRAGDIYVMELDETSCEPGEAVLVDSGIFRNHGMLKLDGQLYVSGAEGIFRLELTDGKWSCVRLFDREVSEFGFVDLDGDGGLAVVPPEQLLGLLGGQTAAESLHQPLGVAVEQGEVGLRAFGVDGGQLVQVPGDVSQDAVDHPGGGV